MERIRTDLHNHFTTKSRVLDPNKVADTVYLSLGSGGICALVNYDDQRYEAFAKVAEPHVTNLGNSLHFKDRNILIVKGEEVPTGDGDLLILGLEEGKHLSQRKGIEYHLQEVAEENCITVLTSPFFMSEVGAIIRENPRFAKLIDGIETHNGEATRKANAQAFELFKLLYYDKGYQDLGFLSCSDGHSFQEVGTSTTTFTSPNSIALLDARQVTSYLRGLIRYAPRIATHTHSTYSAMKHGAILVAQKLRISLSRGDKEALKS